jgi:hypothetical protein
MKMIGNKVLPGATWVPYVFPTGKGKKIKHIIVEGHWAPQGDCTLLIYANHGEVLTKPGDGLDAVVKTNITFLVSADPEQTHVNRFEFDLTEYEVITEKDKFTVGLYDSAGTGGNMQVTIIFSRVGK